MGTATALMALPSTVMSARIGALGMSQSQMSWCVVWNAHFIVPDFTSSATRPLE